MSAENTQQHTVHDENVVSRRVKITAVTSRRPALSNVTNTSSTQAVHLAPRAQTVRSSAAEDTATNRLKRSAPVSVSDDTQQIKRIRVEEEDKGEEGQIDQVPDLDAEDGDDPLMVSEYVGEIFDYLFMLENTTLPRDYFALQTDIKPRMRSILVDWLVEVHLRFRLTPETLFLAINLMDRFLTESTVEVEKLQLLATGCLFIAAKYEEVWSPSVKNYSYVTDGGSTEEEILQAERFILTALNFNLSYPNPMNFLRRISKADNYDIETRTMAKYLLEITVIDYKFLGVKPSLCAAAAMYVSRRLLGRPEWDATLTKYAGGYTLDQMKPAVELMVDYIRAPVVHEEFFKKYASKKYMKASILARQWVKKLDQERVEWI
jgi:G2/mitotic-specific cyclin 1/2